MRATVSLDWTIICCLLILSDEKSLCGALLNTISPISPWCIAGPGWVPAVLPEVQAAQTGQGAPLLHVPPLRPANGPSLPLVCLCTRLSFFPLA